MSLRDFAGLSRRMPWTMGAFAIGAISMIGSDSQAMGRVGEVVMRTWQTAHGMKARRGARPGDGPADNMRAMIGMEQLDCDAPRWRFEHGRTLNLEPGVPAEVRLEIVDPGSHALAFEFDFL